MLGVELAASLTRMGMEVDLLLDREHPWNKFAGSATGHFSRSILRSMG